MHGVEHGVELRWRFRSRIDEYGDPTCVRHQFPQDLLARTVKLIGKNAEPSRVAAWTTQRTCQTGGHHVIRDTDYWNRLRHLQRRAHGRIPANEDGVGARFDHLGYALTVLFWAAAKSHRIDDKISTFDEPLPTQAIDEPRKLGRCSRQLMQNSKTINLIRFLRAHCERPRRR